MKRRPTTVRQTALAQGANIVRGELGAEQTHVRAADPELQVDVPTREAETVGAEDERRLSHIPGVESPKGRGLPPRRTAECSDLFVRRCARRGPAVFPCCPGAG
jgi:hypothetical protein